jgi:hypothetical protein
MIVAVDGDLGGRLNPCGTQRREDLQMGGLPASFNTANPATRQHDGEPYSPRKGWSCTVAQWRLLCN